MDINYKKYHRDEEYNKYESTFRNIFKKRFNLLKTFKKKGRILDIGCSNGVFLDLFKEKGYETWGVEPSKNYKVARAKGHNVINAYFEKADLPEKHFDLVIMNHTLEHLDDPTLILNKVYKLLKKGGIFYVDVPNAGGLSSRILGKRWPYLAPDEHKWQFTKESLGKVFKDSGFKILHFESRSGFFEYANPFLELRRKRFILDLATLPYTFGVTLLNMGDSMSFIAAKART